MALPCKQEETASNNANNKSAQQATMQDDKSDMKPQRRPSIVDHNYNACSGDGSNSSTNEQGSAGNSTKTVPLTLSSVAHVMCLPHAKGGSSSSSSSSSDTSTTSGGVLEGLLSVVHHTLSELSSHAIAPIQATTPWMLVKESRDVTDNEEQHAEDDTNNDHSWTKDLPYAYSKHSFFYVSGNDSSGSTGDGGASKSSATMNITDPNQWWAAANNNNDNNDKNGEIVGRVSLYYQSADDNIQPDDDEDMQQVLLTRVLVEYKQDHWRKHKQTPPFLATAARKQEELSLTSFGNGSVDDNVKLGALSSLYDEVGKYVLHITSVRNNTYRYDVGDGDYGGNITTTTTTPSSSSSSSMAQVTVQTLLPHQQAAPPATTPQPSPPPLTKLELILHAANKNNDDLMLLLRPLSFPTTQLERHFLVWDEEPRCRATAMPSHQTLLLDKQGMYIHGRLVERGTVEWMPPLLFGFNLDGHYNHEVCIPFWHGRVQDYEAVKHAYATMWQEVMIDARLESLNIASTLLDRLMNGLEDDDDDDADDDDYDGNSTNVECLESLLMASPVYDPVGICAKALATRFAQEFGPHAVPCLDNQVEWYKNRMGHKVPIVVPQRVINVLRRGGYFDLQRDTNENWFMEHVRPATDGDESRAVEEAMQLLTAAGCQDAPKVMFVKVDAADPVKNKYMCRYNDALVQYHVNEAVWDVDRPALAIAMYVAQEFPDGNVLLNLVSKQQQQQQQQQAK